MTKDHGAARQALLALAADPEKTPFDYIVVGSGAGGGPLAARLALGGRRVLVLEAGCDPAAPEARRGDPVDPAAFDKTQWREVYAVPAYHAASTEDARISWEFSVRHFADDDAQRADSKYRADKDPSRRGGGKGGIFYPRAAALGGCTAHYAMIVVRPNDADWNEIADATGDDGWRAGAMQGYFGRLERCLYQEVYRSFLQKHFGILFDALLRLVTLINPRRVLDPAGHGFSGWQATSFVSPSLILRIASGDDTFRRLLLKVIRAAIAKGQIASLLRRALLWLQLPHFFDPNRVGVARSTLPLVFIPTGTDGMSRTGVREWLLHTAKAHPDRLVIETGAHVTRILFRQDPAEAAPRAHGVEVAEGLFLYSASPAASGAPDAAPRRKYFARREIVVCGGAFNTPQLLMLSGIGSAEHLARLGIAGPRDADGKAICGIVDLPGVGGNLQDRYELSVISEVEADFASLAGASFLPEDPRDPLRREWLERGSGLYATNGGALALFVQSRSAAGREDPDLFVFGFPAAFRGYYWGYSKELLRASQGGAEEQRNLWSWVILKAYTSNRGGTVRLRSSSPFEQPEINFRSFDEGPAGHEEDMSALLDGIAHVRSLNARTGEVVRREIQPGDRLADGSAGLRDWIRREAWGHHACGTCRIGSAAWQADVGRLRGESRTAVLDSKFRVHGVRGLRVVDASAFPRIPGYFIAAATMMLGEKAADTLLAASPHYPEALEDAEARAVEARRTAARCLTARAPAGAHDERKRLPADTVGLALSGGGIRSATFALGVLQALAAKDRLRDIDVLSTVSGGGFIGSFLGRLYCALEPKPDLEDKAGYVQARLADARSPEISWIRRHADYVAPHGSADWRINLGIFWRNLLAVYLCLAALMLAAFGTLRWAADARWEQLAVEATAWEQRQSDAPRTAQAAAGDRAVEAPAAPPRPATAIERLASLLPASPWWWIPLAVLGLAVLPGSLGFWLTPIGGATGPYPLFPLLAWLTLLAGAVAAFALRAAWPWAALAVALLLLAWVWQELVRWGVPADLSPQARSAVVRNRITRYVGGALVVFLIAAGLVILDGLAWRVARSELMPTVAMTVAGLAVLMPVFRQVLDWLVSRGERAPRPRWQGLGRNAAAALVAFPLAVFLLFGIDVLAHAAFDADPWLGRFAVVLAAAFSLMVGRAFGVLNGSSLQFAYAERVARTFLGATNPDRTHPTRHDAPAEVQFAHPADDVAFDDYHPERSGGPLHLVNVCVNETIDAASGRELREDKGLPMCVGPLGVSVGRRFHALWERGAAARSHFCRERRRARRAGDVLRPLPVAPDPNGFHVFGSKDGKPAPVEPLRLSQWVAISAAAYTTGLGRGSSFPLALLHGLLNVRLGYWWDSGIYAGNRPGRYPPGIVRRVWALPNLLFTVQTKLLSEWRSRFAGPSDRLWYLTDGGHFEVTGLYELVRRRLPLMIAVDAGEDPGYLFQDLALLARQVRMDFGAELHWIDPGPHRKAGKSGWEAFDDGVPSFVQRWFDPDAIGARDGISRTGDHAAALARVTYDDAPGRESWLLLVKASAAGELPLDVQAYAAENDRFPNESTFDQFFSNAQWESYRRLGETLGARIFSGRKRP